MKKLLALCILALLLLVGYVAAGPFMAYNGIRNAVEAQDTAALARHVDFPVLRRNLKAQVDDYLVRRAGTDVQSNLLGAFALRVAGGVAGGAVDTIVTPAGLGALMEGRSALHRITGGGVTDNTYEHAPPDNPLAEPEYGFESTSRFTATVTDAQGQPVEFVLTRYGLQWKLTDIRLPLGR